MVLDLVIRNEDRLPCRHLRWRGNPANLLLADKMPAANMDAQEVPFNSLINRCRPTVIKAFQKERRASSIDGNLTPPSGSGLVSQHSDLSDVTESPKSSNLSVKSLNLDESTSSDFHIVAIDSGVPRRPPAGKRANDQEIYPKLVELIINCSEYSSNILHEITGGKLGSPPDDSEIIDSHLANMASIVHEFRNGFRAALRDLQGFHIFLLTLHQKLENLLRVLITIIDRASSGDLEKEELIVPESPSLAGGFCGHFPSPPCRERLVIENNLDSNDSDLQRSTPRPSSSGFKESSDGSSPVLRESWQGKFKGSGEPLHSLRLASKLRDFNKSAKVCDNYCMP